VAELVEVELDGGEDSLALYNLLPKRVLRKYCAGGCGIPSGGNIQLLSPLPRRLAA
jgi:hypothetical protein